MTLIYIKKLAATENPSVPTPDVSISDYKNGVLIIHGNGSLSTLHDSNVTSLPVDYEVEGDLLHEPFVGQSLQILRHTRNGIARPGVMTTSPVVSIEYQEDTQLKISTKNSVYLLEYLGEVV